MVVGPLFKSDLAKVFFWTHLTWAGPIFILIFVCVLSKLLHVFDGMPLVGEEFSPLQALLFSSGIFLPMSVYFYANSERGLANAEASRNWPSTRGVVLSSGISQRYILRWGTAYQLDVAYKYQVGEKSYVGHRVSFGSWRVLDQDFIMDLAAKYQEGAETLVHYDHDNPASAALEVSVESAAAFARDDKRRSGMAGLLPVVVFLVVGLRAAFH